MLKIDDFSILLSSTGSITVAGLCLVYLVINWNNTAANKFRSWDNQ